MYPQKPSNNTNKPLKSCGVFMVKHSSETSGEN